jgi:hypothetical protein
VRRAPRLMGSQSDKEEGGSFGTSDDNMRLS